MSSAKPIVVVTEPLDDRSLAWLGERAEVRRIEIDQLDEHIGDADGLVVRTYTLVTPELLERAPKLKVVGRAGVALDNIDVPACRARGVEVVHTPAANTLAVVDYTVRMMIELNRRFWPMAGPMTEEEFFATRKNKFGRFLAEMTLGIIGVGRIGSRVGRAAVGLGMTVLYNDILDVELGYPAEAVSKDDLYPRSDLVTIHVPLTDLTRGMIDAAALAKFKPGAQLINAARGACVVSADLAEALREGRLSGAVVDCHEPEPPPADYPLFGLDNVILTPHIAARVPKALENMCDVVRDVAAVLEGRKPEYPAQEGSY
jgi:phosphoglycerate dehydrogenase-like enzyme